MPIVNIQLVIEDTDSIADGVVQALADRLGELFGSDPGGVWVKVSCLPRSQYAENRSCLSSAIKPTFVEILHRRLPETPELAQQADRVADVVAAVLGRAKENTHVLFLPEGAFRVAFGGKLLGA